MQTSAAVGEAETAFTTHRSSNSPVTSWPVAFEVGAVGGGGGGDDAASLAVLLHIAASWSPTMSQTSVGSVSLSRGAMDDAEPAGEESGGACTRDDDGGVMESSVAIATSLARC